MPNVVDRAKRLDELEASVRSYVRKQREELELRVATAKKLLKGRTGSERLAQATVQGAQPLVQEEIDQFLNS
jgi:hypothetical protein